MVSRLQSAYRLWRRGLVMAIAPVATMASSTNPVEVWPYLFIAAHRMRHPTYDDASAVPTASAAPSARLFGGASAAPA